MLGAVIVPVAGSGKNTLQWSEGPLLVKPSRSEPPRVILVKPGLSLRTAMTVSRRIAKSWRTTVPCSINGSPGIWWGSAVASTTTLSDLPQRPGLVVENAQVGKLLSEAGPVRRVDPGNDARAMLLIVGGAPTGEHCFAGGQLPDCHRLDVPRMLFGEIAVELFVVLAVIADQHPLDRGKLGGEPCQGLGLVLPPATEPAVGGRAPICQEQRPARVQVPGEESRQRGRDVPRAGRQVQDRGARIGLQQPLVEHRHPGYRVTRVFVKYKGVPGRQQ